MKKIIKPFVYMLLMMAIAPNKSWAMWDLWENEDEESNMKSFKTSATPTIPNNQANKSVYSPSVSVQQTQYTTPVNSNNYITQTGGYSTMPVSQPVYITNTMNRNYGNIDYDTLQSERVIDNSELANSINKWKNGIVSVFWENYRGNNVRIEILRNNRDVKEMRLKFVQSQNMTSDPDGSISDMLNVVANQVMKRTCGKNAKQSIILYERPSVELERETAADGYKIMAKGTSLKEYGFRCIY